jgi:hypothetical protein
MQYFVTCGANVRVFPSFHGVQADHPAADGACGTAHALRLRPSHSFYVLFDGLSPLQHVHLGMIHDLLFLETHGLSHALCGRRATSYFLNHRWFYLYQFQNFPCQRKWRHAERFIDL